MCVTISWKIQPLDREQQNNKIYCWTFKKKKKKYERKKPQLTDGTGKHFFVLSQNVDVIVGWCLQTVEWRKIAINQNKNQLLQKWLLRTQLNSKCCSAKRDMNVSINHIVCVAIKHLYLHDKSKVAIFTLSTCLW